MPVGRYFRGLTAYDLLGNLIPGVVAVIAIMGFLPQPPIPSTIGGYALFAIISFSVGSIVQAHASAAVGDRQSFNKTMAGVENLPSLTKRVNEGDSAEKGQKSNSSGGILPDPIVNVVHALCGPLFWWVRDSIGEELDDVILVNRIWEHLIDTYEIPYNTESYSVLYHLMSSKVDDARSPSRATRIQALRNFHRGMWIASWYLLVSIIVSMTLDHCFDAQEVIYDGVKYSKAAYFEYWTPLWHLGFVAGVAVILFWYLFESSDEDYIEYLFADYAVGITTGSTEVEFDGVPKFEHTGTVSANINEGSQEDNSLRKATDSGKDNPERDSDSKKDNDDDSET